MIRTRRRHQPGPINRAEGNATTAPYIFPHRVGTGSIIEKTASPLQRQTSAIADDSRHSGTRRNLSALLTTDTDDRLIASAASIGDSVMPSSGYSTPAASGTPAAL